MVLQQLLGEAEGSPAVRRVLTQTGTVRCDELLPVVQAHLQQSARYRQALEDITDSTIEGCLADAARSEHHKARGTKAFQAGQYDVALREYSDALGWLDETSPAGQSAAAALHCNRTLCLLKLQPPHAQAALSEADAAVAADPQSHKALYRRASAHVVLGEHTAAERDLVACLALLGTTAAAPAASAEQRTVLQLLEQVQLRAQPGTQSAVPTADLTTHAETVTASTASTATATLNTASTAAASTADYLSTVTANRLTLTHTSTAGRELQARVLLTPGTDVIRESPVALVVLKSQRGARCWGCAQPLKRVVTALPDGNAKSATGAVTIPVYCRACPMVQYCSITCRDTDPYHTPSGVECRVAWARVLPEHAVLATRLHRAHTHAQSHSHTHTAADHTPAPTTPTNGRALLNPTCVSCQPSQVPQQDSTARQPNSVCAPICASEHSTAKQAGRADSQCTVVGLEGLVSDLCDHMSEGRDANTALERCVLATLCSDVLGRLAGRMQPGERVPAPTDMLRALLQVDLNCVALRPSPTHTSTPSLSDDSTAISDAQYAVGVYPAVACINHECDPSLTLRFVDGCTVMGRVTRPVDAATPVSISYGPQIGEHVTSCRRRHLKTRYHFTCTCDSCKRPSAQEALWGRYRCALRCPRPGCSGGWAPCGNHAHDLADLVHDWEPQPGSRATHRTQDRYCGVCGLACGADSGQQTVPQGPQGLPVVACDICEQAVAAEVVTETGRSLAQVQALNAEADALCSQAEEDSSAAVWGRALAVRLQVLAEERRLLHVGNVRQGSSAHSAARACSKLLANTDRSGGVQYERLVRMRASLLQQSVDGLMLHYPVTSTQVAQEMSLYAESLQDVCSLEAKGSDSDTHERAGRLRCTATRTLRLHFG